MQLTLYTDYSLRLLMYLALHPEGATITEVAERYKISRNHLVRIVHDLGKKGWIHTTRGRSGGVKLARAPQEIGLADLVQETEPNFHLVECFNPENNACVIAPACKLKKILWDAKQAFLAELAKHTLADVVENQAELLDSFPVD